MKPFYKRLLLYILGLFILALGVSFSIIAGFGVSPVSALPYALSLTTGFSVGFMTVAANFLYTIFQVILNKRMDWREFLLQLILGFLFGFFINLTLLIMPIMFPMSSNIIIRFIYLLCSLFVVAAGLFFYFIAKLPVMPYDGMIYAVSEYFDWKISKSKILGDVINVTISCIICLIIIHQLGSIGIGTIIAAVFIGKILGLYMGLFQKQLQYWIDKSKPSKKFI